MVVHDEKYERAFRVLTTEMFSLWLKLHVLSTVVEAHLSQDEKGMVDKASTNYLRSHGDQAFISFFDHLRQMANPESSDPAAITRRSRHFGVSSKPCAYNIATTWPSENGVVYGAPYSLPLGTRSRLGRSAVVSATKSVNRIG